MRIAIAKPDYGIRGGFEIVLDRLARELSESGHTVSWLTVDVASLPREPYAVTIPPDVWDAAPEFFRYAGIMEAFRNLRPGAVDLVLTTQPPSFAIDHRRKLALFFHHHRLYYDLADAYMQAGFADTTTHAAGCDLVRALDQPRLDEVEWFLAGSQHVADRLAEYSNAGSRTSVCRVGLKYEVAPSTSPPPRGGTVLCVGRHEFPKRTELAVHAMSLLPGRRGVVVGSGGRLGRTQQLAARFAHENQVRDPTELWLTSDPVLSTSNALTDDVVFESGVTDEELSTRYVEAAVVLAPAYLEDYGLTALEAMAHGRPVVVCSDGGGLAEIVEDGVTGRVVEPSGPAIAAAVEELLSDPAELTAMGERARSTAATYTWARTMADFSVGLEQVMA